MRRAFAGISIDDKSHLLVFLFSLMQVFLVSLTNLTCEKFKRLLKGVTWIGYDRIDLVFQIVDLDRTTDTSFSGICS